MVQSGTYCALGEVGNPASIVQSWLRNWQRVITFFDYPPEIREVIYTTNAIESVKMTLAKITVNRGAVSTRRAAEQIVLLGTQEYQAEMEHANSGLEGSAQSVY